VSAPTGSPVPTKQALSQIRIAKYACCIWISKLHRLTSELNAPLELRPASLVCGMIAHARILLS
jgi:hypothetical protein